MIVVAAMPTVEFGLEVFSIGWCGKDSADGAFLVTLGLQMVLVGLLALASI